MGVWEYGSMGVGWYNFMFLHRTYNSQLKKLWALSLKP
jgi:hypothetical protein